MFNHPLNRPIINLSENLDSGVNLDNSESQLIFSSDIEGQQLNDNSNTNLLMTGDSDKDDSGRRRTMSLRSSVVSFKMDDDDEERARKGVRGFFRQVFHSK